MSYFLKTSSHLVKAQEGSKEASSHPIQCFYKTHLWKLLDLDANLNNLQSYLPWLNIPEEWVLE